MTTLVLLEEVRQAMVEAGIARNAETAGPLPPVWLTRADGAPAPGEGQGPGVDQNLVIELRPGVSPGSTEFEGFLHIRVIDFTYRSRRPDVAERKHLEVKRLFDDKRGNFLMGDIRVEQALQTTGLGLVASDPGQGYTFRASFGFWVRDWSFGT